MAVKIRLAKLGCLNKAFYRIVAADSHTPRDGKHLRVVGFYDTLAGSLFFFLPFSYYFHMLNNFVIKDLNFVGEMHLQNGMHLILRQHY
ncbi:hypothetical protein POTOM_058521 [Populus tomentosa]|uniref:Uncharacterized protein n=1 Tax=Populus tomentosa TaxID=118781 RepID=A0A8X7XRI9_POPTO|nr:hypothetical protein POTOM_058521 [Populus tomentosa]